MTSIPTNSPLQELHDDDGRLISLSFESQLIPCPSPAGDGWLVAIDGSEHAMRALAEAIRFSKERGVHWLDLVNVQPWLSKEAAQAELAKRGQAAAAQACAMLDQEGFGWRLHVLMGEPAKRLIGLSRTLGSRGLVIGARGLSTTEGLLLGSVAQQLISTAPGAVLVVRPAPATAV